MDDNNNQFKDSLNQAPGFDAQEPLKPNDNLNTNVHSDNLSEQDKAFFYGKK